MKLVVTIVCRHFSPERGSFLPGKGNEYGNVKFSLIHAYPTLMSRIEFSRKLLENSGKTGQSMKKWEKKLFVALKMRKLGDSGKVRSWDFRSNSREIPPQIFLLGEKINRLVNKFIILRISLMYQTINMYECRPGCLTTQHFEEMCEIWQQMKWKWHSKD